MFYICGIDATRQCDAECGSRINVQRIRRAVRRLRQAVNSRRRRHASSRLVVRSHQPRFHVFQTSLFCFLTGYGYAVRRIYGVMCQSVCYGCIVAKRFDIRPKLLLIINTKKSHIGFQIKSLTLDDLKGQYCDWNFIGCSVFSLATAEFFVFIKLLAAK